MQPDEIVKRQRAAVHEHLRLENEKKWQAVYDTFEKTKGGMDLMPAHMRFEGQQGQTSVPAIYSVFDTAIPDFVAEPTHEYHVPGVSIIELTFTGTHKGDYAGIKATGKPICIEFCVIYEFDKKEPTKLATERLYFDHETMLKQMRGEKDAPQGVGLKKRGIRFSYPPV